MSARFIWLLIGCFHFISCKGRFYKVPGGSMEKTIMAGESIWVTPSDKFKLNDIAVFDYYGRTYNNPEDFEHAELHKQVFRIVGMSGQTLEIKMNQVWLDKKLLPAPDSALFNYTIKTHEIMGELLNEYSSQPHLSNNTYEFIGPLTQAYADNLKKDQRVVSIIQEIFVDTIQNFGPLHIPEPGEIIKVTESNFSLFKNIPGIHLGRFEIKEPLYFLMGDNRDAAQDSRFNGLISHSKMKGVVKL